MVSVVSAGIRSDLLGWHLTHYGVALSIMNCIHMGAGTCARAPALSVVTALVLLGGCHGVASVWVTITWPMSRCCFENLLVLKFNPFMIEG